tara:strand:+ start:72 stop:2447 length:2376 start_codon:yes stop_codon:yes gene_type:complete
MEITIFKSIKDISVPFYRGLEVILLRIKEGSSQELVEKIRKEKDKEARNLLKQELPAICFSGKFNKREDKAIDEHSGIICLDFDGFKTKKTLKDKRLELQKDIYTRALFTSPSGNGLKVLVEIPPDVDDHKKFFLSLQDYYNCPEFDKSCKNVSRVCYESYDPKLYYNPKSEMYDSMETVSHEQYEYNVDPPTLIIKEQDVIVSRLKKWWEAKYGMIEGERNNNIYILASALNDFGVEKGLATYVMGEYIGNGFSDKEMQTTINSAYKNTANFNTKYFEDSETIDNVRSQLKCGVPKKEIRSKLKDSGFESEEVNTVIKHEEDLIEKKDFWTKSERGVIRIIPFKFKEFLEDHGFYKHQPSGSNNYIFIHIKSNRIDNTNEDKMKDYVLNYLSRLPDLSIYNHFADKTRYFKEDFLSLLSYKEVEFKKDTDKSAYIYFDNVAIRITQSGVEAIEYDSLDGYVWKDQVINRDFHICDDTECDYKKFIYNISENDSKRIKAVESTIGFLLHGYKNTGYCPAVIINDEVISDDPEGGTGKGLFVQGVAQLKKMVTIDGKAFYFERSFAYQLVSADTQILTFDDVKKNFEFERLFSVITEGITLEKKNKDAIRIPFNTSPKVVITTNYAIKGKGNSYERRKWELEFFAHYSKEHTPYDEFKRLFFSEWDEDEWCKFDNYMVNCLQNYLRTGFITAPFKNLKDRKFEAETCREFVTFLHENKDLIPYDKEINSNSVRIEFILQNPDFSKLSHSKWNKWMRLGAKYLTKQDPREGRSSQGIWFIFKEPVTQTKITLE